MSPKNKKAAAPAAAGIPGKLAPGYFLPYQTEWLNDRSPIKIWEKSRRIGATYIQSYEDVRDCVAGTVPAVWFSSADESAAKEYISYCEMWVKVFHAVAESRGQVLLDPARDIKTFVIEFASGRKIHALSSNPKAFRSKGGKVVLDEFAWHDDPDRMWAAARPAITWGHPLRILSTHNGTNCRFYRSIEDIKKGKLSWKLHTVPIQKAVDEGLLDKIMQKKATAEEKAAWLEDLRNDCVDENTWLQEYCCIAVDEASAFLPYEMIADCEDKHCLMPLEDTTGDLYLGYDVGRRKDLSVMWVLEHLGNALYTRMFKVMEKTPFKHQREALYSALAHPRLRRACIDNTGIGMQLAEEAQDAFGKYRVEAVTFSNSSKEEMAFGVKNGMDDRMLIVPDEFDIREDLHSIRKVTTAAGNVRFDVTASEARGHADRFWALALGKHAAGLGSKAGIITVTTRRRRDSSRIMKGY
ncbi:MAG: terminase family protein [Candidatus Edwardsbacteria bacterium]|nr:terminase family protein [Candidatus Edwardsbacteria bacterium]